MARAGADTASIVTQSSHGHAGKSIYPRGPTFSLDTFTSKDFIVKDFVESLSDGAAQSSRRSGAYGQAFDPKPFIRAFEHAVSRLGQLSDDQERRETEAAGAVRKAEAQHKQHCTTLQSKLDQALDAFNGLEERFEPSQDTNISHRNNQKQDGGVALQIGERLGELARQKKRAEDARFLIQCWQDLNETGELLALEDRKRLGGSDGKVKCAHIARALLKISDRLDNEGNSPLTNGSRLNNGIIGVNGVNGVNGTARLSDNGRRRNKNIEIIEKFLEKLEKDLLNQFDDCYAERDFDGMRECSTALYDFSEGASVIGRFVNQHEFFMNQPQANIGDVPEETQAWDRLADPDTEPPGVEPSLQLLVDDVKQVLEEESFIIRRAFGFYDQVLTTFIQRIFQQSIQQRLESVLEKAGSFSSLAFLRTLKSSRSYIGGMVEDLKSHGLTEHPDTISPRISSILDQQLEDLFIPYFAGGSYIDREKKNLEELYSSLLVKYTIYHTKRSKTSTTSTTYLGSLGKRGRDLLASAKDAYMERLDSSDLPASQKAILLRIAGLSNANTGENNAEIEVTEEDGTVSLSNAKRMLKWLAECVGRGLELSMGNETPKDVSALQSLLLQQMGEIYIDTALDQANEKAVLQENVRSVPDLGFITDLQIALSVVHLMIVSINSMLIPLATPNLSVRREMERSRQLTITRIEDKIDAVRQRTIDVALNWVVKLLARQNKYDFRPKDEAINIEQLQTPTCLSIFNFLSKVRDMSSKAFEGINLEVFLTELASGFRSLLLDHFTKFYVNLAGGLMVSKDITKYIELLRTFQLAPSFQPSLEVLSEIGNLFVIGPEALKERLRGGSALSGVDKKDLQPYIIKREDVNSVGVQSVLNSL